MLGLGWSLLKGLTAIVCIVGIISLALAYFIPAPPSTFKIATGFKGGSALFVGARYKEGLARHHVTLEVRLMVRGGTISNF